MSIPAKSDPRWKKLLSGSDQPPFSSLAIRLLVTRLRQDVAKTPGSMTTAIDELYGFFSNNKFAEKDVNAF
jgi:hypothetical protein